MLALVLALGPSLDAFCASCCVCGRSWPVFVRLGALRARFWEGLGSPGHGFGGPKKTIFRGFCVQTWQRCTDAPTLTKHWQERQKPRFLHIRTFPRKLKKPYELDPGAFCPGLPTKIVLQTRLPADFGGILGPLGRLLASFGLLLGVSWPLLGASWALLAISWLVCGAPSPRLGVRRRPRPPFSEVLGRARLGFGQLLKLVWHVFCCASHFVTYRFYCCNNCAFAFPHALPFSLLVRRSVRSTWNPSKIEVLKNMQIL